MTARITNEQREAIVRKAIAERDALLESAPQTPDTKDEDPVARSGQRNAAALPRVTPYNVGRWCLSEDECIAQGINFAAYERGVSDAANAFANNAQGEK